MTANKVFIILENFGKIEMNRLRKFLASPYFNKNKAIYRLFLLFRNIIVEKEEHIPTKEKIWAQIYGKDVKYDDVRFRKLNSELLKLIERFLAEEELDKDEMQVSNYLMQSITNRKLSKIYNSTIKKARLLTESHQFRSSTYYFRQYELERNLYELDDLELKRTDKGNLELIIDNLDKFYLAEKLKWYCSILSRKDIASHEYSLLFIDEIVQHVEKFKYEDCPPVQIYYYAFKLYHELNNNTSYKIFVELLNKNNNSFSKNELLVLYGYATNYCINKINQGIFEFHEEFFNINETLIKTGLIIGHGDLSPWRFKNIIQNALRLNKFNWVEEFIGNYQKHINSNFRENAVTYNTALLRLYQKKYDQVMQLLQNVDYEDEAYNLGSKSMLITVYFEMDYLEPLYSLFDSFRAYLSRNKSMNEKRKLLYYNLIKFTKKLTKLQDNDFKKLEDLKNEVKENPVASDKWLLEKIDEKEQRGRSKRGNR